jgi:hypothetical protein
MSITREVAVFVEDLIGIEDQADGKSPFGDIWQAFATGQSRAMDSSTRLTIHEWCRVATRSS